MERREFLKYAGAGIATGFIKPYNVNLREIRGSDDLDYHKITDIRFTTVRLNYPRQVGKNSQLDIHGYGPVSGVHILFTAQGATGWGLNRGTEKALNEKFELIRGKSVAELIYPATGITSPDIEGFDFSLYDLAGSILEKPVYRLLGKRRPLTFPCYSGMIYFDDLEPADNPAGPDKILEECRWDYNYGYRQFKLKIGRGNKWMEKEKGLQRDIEITRLVDRNFPDCDILVDGNNGFTVDEFIKYMEGIEGIRLFWIEEPFHETIEDYAKLHSWLRIHNLSPLLADGEAKPDEKVLRQLGMQKIITVFLQDIASLGFTRWISFIKEIRQMGILASPHAWGSAIKTNYISHLAGAFGTTATIEGVTCTSDDVDLTDYKLRKGKLIPSSKPGFGMDLLKKIP
ncbi:MAG TPA: mandelate racemase/muconate lactonizing protein [Bacteroidales bacterium]|nr:mandelate racemase/muconate lactonizing protein [Bacteroidales bacterium]